MCCERTYLTLCFCIYASGAGRGTGLFLDCVCDSVSRHRVCPRLGCSYEHSWGAMERDLDSPFSDPFCSGFSHLLLPRRVWGMNGGRIGGAQGGTVIKSMCNGPRLTDVGPCPTTHYVTLQVESFLCSGFLRL